MTLVVAPAVAQVDPADERHVLFGVVAVLDDEQLLVVRAEAADPLVEQRFRTGLVELDAEPLVLLRAERRVVGVRPPQQAADLDAPTSEVAQQLADARSVRQQALVGVSSP